MRQKQKAVADNEVIRILRYLIVGGGNTAIGVSLILVFMGIIALEPHLSNALAYGITFFTSYASHRWFTFRSRGKKRQELPRFALIYALSYAVNFVALSLFLVFMSPIASQIGASIVFVLASYAGQRIFVFMKIKNNGCTERDRAGSNHGV